MCSLLKRLLLASLLLAAACSTGAERTTAPFEEALPQPDILRVALPQASSEEPAELYRLSRGVARMVNGGLLGIIGPTGALLARARSALRDQDSATWEAAIPDEGARLRVAVQRLEPTFFVYTAERVLEGTDPLLLFEGTYSPGRGGDARGSVLLLLEHDADPKTHGKLEVRWSRLDGERTLTASLFGAALPADRPAADTSGEPRLDAVAHSVERADGGGSFIYGPLAWDVFGGSGAEIVRVNMRWVPGGAGRVDLFATGGDLKGHFRQLIISQCWAAPSFDAVWTLRQARAERPELQDLGEEGSPRECPEGLRTMARPDVPELGPEPDATSMPAGGHAARATPAPTPR